MTLFDTPIRLLLVAIFSVALPLLCCCSVPAAVAEVDVEVAPVNEHACCTLPTTQEDAPAPLQQHPQEDCDCETHVEAPTSLDTQALVINGLNPAPWLFDLPAVPAILLASVGSPTAPVGFASLESDSPAVAPTLRALSVLLTV